MSRFYFPWRRESWRVFWHQRTVALPILLAAGSVVASWLVAARTPSLPGESHVVRYSIYLGANWIGDDWVSFLPPLVATLFVGVNVALAYLTARRTLVVQQVWLWSAALVGVGFLWQTLLLAWFNS